MYELTAQLRAIRRTGTPLVALQTPDLQATEVSVLEVMTAREEVPVLHWDCVSGVKPLNDQGGDIIGVLATAANPMLARDLRQVLPDLLNLPMDTVVILHHVPAFWHDASVLQGLSNLRDPCKQKGVTLILLCTMCQLPAALVHDVVVLDEPLPGPEALKP